MEGKTKIKRFYNATNFVCEVKGDVYGKVKDVGVPVDVHDARTWNTRVFVYDSKARKESNMDKDELITISCKSVYDP